MRVSEDPGIMMRVSFLYIGFLFLRGPTAPDKTTMHTTHTHKHTHTHTHAHTQLHTYSHTWVKLMLLVRSRLGLMRMSLWRMKSLHSLASSGNNPDAMRSNLAWSEGDTQYHTYAANEANKDVIRTRHLCSK
jgi:hypothetical protein